jgi:hypothetical protein
MRKGVLGSIAALTAGAGLAFGQGPPPAVRPPAGGYDVLVPAAGQVAPIPPYLGGGDGPAVVPATEPALNGAPVYPPPGPYGATTYQAPPGLTLGGRVVAPHVWLDTEYLLWWSRKQPITAPLITTGASTSQGIVGQPSTQVLVGGADLGYGLFSGFRVTGGWFKGDDRRIGVEFSGFLLGQKSVDYFARSDANGVPLIARPFTIASTGAQGSLIVAAPNLASGNILFRTTSQTWGAEGNGVLNLYRSCPDDSYLMTINGLLGFRYFELDELIDIASASTLLGTATSSFAGLTITSPSTISVEDKYRTTNRFYGGQIGLKGEVYYGKWFFAATGKLAVGDMNETLEVSGLTGVNDPTRGLAAVNPGGLLANFANINTLRKDEFVYIPEVIGKIGYNWSSWLSTYVGYNFIYVSKVLRPGNQISDVVNPTLVPSSPSYGAAGGGATPNVLLTQSHYWIQGVSFGIQMKY